MSQRLETSNEDSYLTWGRPSNLLKTRFSSARLEKLYRASSLQQRRGGLTCFLMSAILYGVYTLATPGFEVPARGVSGIFLGLSLVLLIWAERGTVARNTLWSLMPCVVWQLWIWHLLAQLLLRSAPYLKIGSNSVKVTPRDSLGWMLLLIYLLFTTLPLRLCRCTFLAFITAIMYVCFVIFISSPTLQEFHTQPLDVLVGNATPRCLVLDESSCTNLNWNSSRLRSQVSGSSREGWSKTPIRNGARENWTARTSRFECRR